jgi:hypothetical protein
MRQRMWAYLAATWAVLFAAPHVYWATGRTEGLGTALSNEIVDDAGVAMAVNCALIAVIRLCGAAVALGTVRPWPARLDRAARRTLLVLAWFGAVLLVARSVDIFVEFSLGLTGVWTVPAERHDNYLYLARWFMFFWLPWFALGAIAWWRLAWTYARSGPPVAMVAMRSARSSAEAA